MSKMPSGLVSGQDCSLSWRGHLLSVAQVVLLFMCKENALCSFPSSYKIAIRDTLGTLHKGLHLSSLMDPSLHTVTLWIKASSQNFVGTNFRP